MGTPARLSALLIVAAVLVGSTVGVGLFTFGYAEGLSYFSSDPRACVNCHIMNDEYRSWTRSSHHAVAACVDCHLPHSLLPKLIAKAENGWHHSKGFTLEDFHEPIMIKEKNARILQESCLSCHGDLVHDIVGGSSTARGAVSCVHCHVHVGHGARP
jgi:cytochrome c nitrite reductase small subunit